MTNAIVENNLLRTLTRRFDRSPLQLNRQLEADAEIIRLPNGGNLAVTIDTVAEEIAAGLYDDPYLAGWMVVTASLSDLAAVGALPLGLLISEVLPEGFPPASIDRLQAGIDDACRHHRSHVLGGDTNTGGELLLTGCAIGTVEHPLSRMGCLPGEHLYTTGPLGRGNAFALARHLGWSGIFYRPTARLREGRTLVGKATACMDTSDGVLATLDQLMRLNGCGFELDEPLFLDDAARAVGERAGAPWLLLAGEHGEFELLFTLPAGRERELDGWAPVHLGRVIAEQEIRLVVGGRLVAVDTGRTRNMRSEAGGGLREYVRALFHYDEELRRVPI